MRDQDGITGEMRLVERAFGLPSGMAEAMQQLKQQMDEATA